MLQAPSTAQPNRTPPAIGRFGPRSSPLSLAAIGAVLWRAG